MRRATRLRFRPFLRIVCATSNKEKHSMKKKGWIVGIVVMSVLTLLALAMDVVLIILS